MIKWRKCLQTEGLSDSDVAKFYRCRANVVRAVQKQNIEATQKNAELQYVSVKHSHKKIELSEKEIDTLAREAFDTEMMPILHDNNILLTKAPVLGDSPC